MFLACFKSSFLFFLLFIGWLRPFHRRFSCRMPFISPLALTSPAMNPPRPPALQTALSLFQYSCCSRRCGQQINHWEEAAANKELPGQARFASDRSSHHNSGESQNNDISQSHVLGNCQSLILNDTLLELLADQMILKKT